MKGRLAAALVRTGQPFFQSSAGALSLLLLGALLTGAVSWFLTYRRDVRQQNRVLFRLSDAIMPEGRMGLVERVERVESNLSVAVTELESHMTLSATQRVELLASMSELRTYVESELRNRGGSVILSK